MAADNGKTGRRPLGPTDRRVEIRYWVRPDTVAVLREACAPGETLADMLDRICTLGDIIDAMATDKAKLEAEA